MSWTARLRKFFEAGLTLPGLRGSLQRGEIPYGAGCVDELEAGGLVLTQGQTIVGGPQGVPVATGGANAITIPPPAQSTFVRMVAQGITTDGDFRYANVYGSSQIFASQLVPLDTAPYSQYVAKAPGTVWGFTFWGSQTGEPELEFLVNGSVVHTETMNRTVNFTTPNLYDLSGAGITLVENDRLQVRVKFNATTLFFGGSLCLQILHDDDSRGGFNMIFSRSQNFNDSTPFVADGAFGAQWHHFPAPVQLQNFSIVSDSADSTTRIPIYGARFIGAANNNRLGTLVVGSAKGAGPISPAINVAAATFIGLNPNFQDRIVGTDPGVATISIQGASI